HQMWAAQFIRFNGPRLWLSSSGLGSMGFGLPAAIGVKMAQPERPVVAILGDGSSMYAIQALWSAAKYDVGVLIVVMANGRYAIMDQLAKRHGDSTPDGVGSAPWPAFDGISISQIAGGLGCPARVVSTYRDLLQALDEVIPTLATRREPLVLEVTVQ
ncbi:MAG: thiamine pyrophosphate-dependent enzyme, partial [Nakamurella sp.]